MRRKRERLHHRRQRPVLSDTLPFEVPASFSNRHFFDILVEHDVQIIGNSVRWECSDDSIDEAIYVLSGIDRLTPVTQSQEVTFGKLRHFRSLEFQKSDTVKVPYAFQISHRESEFRTLSIPHPFSQIMVANFYNDYAESIIYYSSLSPFSIRFPSIVARYSNHRDRMHERLLAKQENFEEEGKEYDQIGSFFAYKFVNNVFKFFESHRYHRAEKRFDFMLQVDVSKCFDSIYTHSLPWAVFGKSSTKDDLSNVHSTFSARFDQLMQSLNHAETNGIVIGPEFSRIFAEVLLQSVDRGIEVELREQHKLRHRRDYEIFRYVDDYFIFLNNDVSGELLEDVIENQLSTMKLHLNLSKTKRYEKPLITEITIAKSSISALVKDKIQSSYDRVEQDDENADPIYSFSAKARSRDLIIGYKTILKTASVSYPEVGNYTFALLENSIDRILVAFTRSHEGHKSSQRLTDVLENVLEFAFFIYASAPRVNLSIRLARIVAVVSRGVRKIRLPLELRHHLFKFSHDNIVHQLRKNRVSDYREIESLYLLTALRELGRDYWLPEDDLRKHMRIEKNDQNELMRGKPMSYLAITVLLHYIKGRRKYQNLRNFAVDQIIEKLESKSSYSRQDAEVVMLFLDAVACPYISAADKLRMSATFGLDANQLAKLSSITDNWFTSWTDFNLSKELDAKRYRDVY